MTTEQVREPNLGFLRYLPGNHYNPSLSTPFESSPVRLSGLASIILLNHNTKDDCWLIINNVVVDVDEFRCHIEGNSGHDFAPGTGLLSDTI